MLLVGDGVMLLIMLCVTGVCLGVSGVCERECLSESVCGSV